MAQSALSKKIGVGVMGTLAGGLMILGSSCIDDSIEQAASERNYVSRQIGHEQMYTYQDGTTSRFEPSTRKALANEFTPGFETPQQLNTADSLNMGLALLGYVTIAGSLLTAYVWQPDDHMYVGRR